LRNQTSLSYKFVEYIPENIEDGMMYISISFATVVHKCCCGCGNEVITPLSPTDWKLIFDGQTVSIDPSIGNWGFNCKSHYWIKQNQIIWARQWSQEEISAGRAYDRLAKKTYLNNKDDRTVSDDNSCDKNQAIGFWGRLKRWLSDKGLR
jgi:hypothetical protein